MTLDSSGTFGLARILWSRPETLAGTGFVASATVHSRFTLLKCPAGTNWYDPPTPRRRVAMTPNSLYVSRRVCLPPIVAATAFDILRLAAADCDEPSTWSLESPPALLVLNDMRLLPDDPTFPLRQVPGRLRATSGRRSYPVELEVTAWSGSRSEIAVRLVGRSVPLDDGWRQRRYLDLAHAAADHLAVTFETVVGAWHDDVAREAVAEAAR
jgi:hypothetical protein